MNLTYQVEQERFQAFVNECIKEMNSVQKNMFLRASAIGIVGMLTQPPPLGTPVATGRARAGWGAIPGSVQPIGKNPKAEAQGLRKSKYRERLDGPKPYVEIFNGVKYVIYLELGSSLQAPAGFVRLAMRRASGNFVKDTERATIAALRRANIKSRLATGLRQGRLTRRTTTGEVARIAPWVPPSWYGL